jgi:hypothetical protein
MPQDPAQTAPARNLAGACLCGKVRYSVKNEFVYALICHCSDCRKATGSAFKPFAGIELSKLHITKGEDRILRFGDAAACDIHCSHCGALLYSIVRDGEFAHVTLGSLIDDPGIRPSAHIFVGSKAPWDEITDDLPRYDGHVT